MYLCHKSGSDGSEGRRFLVESELKFVENVLLPDVEGQKGSRLDIVYLQCRRMPGLRGRPRKKV